MKARPRSSRVFVTTSTLALVTKRMGTAFASPAVANTGCMVIPRRGGGSFRAVAVARLRQLPAQHFRGDQRAQHLRGAAADGEHAHVARHALQGQVARIAACAEELQRIVDDSDGALGGDDLGLRRQHGIGEGAAVGPARARRLIKHQPRGGELRLHVGQHPLQALKFGDRPAELLALLRPIERVLERTGGDAHRDRARPDALAVIGVHQVGKAALESRWRQHHHLRRNFQVLEREFPFRHSAQAHGLLALCDAEPFRRALVRVAYGEEAADAEALALLVIDAREDQVQP